MEALGLLERRDRPALRVAGGDAHERLEVTLDADVDADGIERHLQTLVRIAAGDPQAGPIAALEQSERFHWLVAPSSTVVQPSAVHTGLCDDPAVTLERLFAELVS